MFSAPSPVVSHDTASIEAATLIGRLKLPVPADTVYAETRFVHVLRKPLQLRGQLHYGGNGVLGKRVDEPYRETTNIAGGEVEVQREGKPPRKFSLERAPELQALLASFSALLGGDADALAKHFEIALAHSGTTWQLTLTPRTRDLASHLHDIVVDGRDAEVSCLTLHEADGDSSVMRLSALAVASLPDATPAALAALCRGSAH